MERQGERVAVGPGIELQLPGLGDEGKAEGRLDVEARGENEARDQHVFGGGVEAQVGLVISDRHGLKGWGSGEDERHGGPIGVGGGE